MGILSHIKHLAPLSLYLTGLLFALRGFMGDGRWALLLVSFLIPLRNIIAKIEMFPLGTQSIDLWVGGAMIGWLMARVLHNRRLFAPSPLNIIIVVLVVYTFFSWCVGNAYLEQHFGHSYADNRIKDLKNYCLMPLLFFITLNHVWERTWINRILAAMALSMVMVEYYTLIQVHEYSSLLSRDKIHGTFDFLGPNEVAAFFDQYTVILMGIYFCLKKSRIKWALLGIIGVNMVCIVFLYSRGAYLGLFAGLAILFFMKDKKLLLLLALAVICWRLVLPPEAVERIEGTTDEFGQLDVSSQNRIIIWHQALDLFKSSPIIGIGYGSFRYLGLILGDTHNIYIKILVEQGIIGMLIFLLVVFNFWRMGFYLYKKGEDDLSRGMGLGLMVSLSTCLINNLFGDRWTYFELSAFLWIFTGLVGRLSLSVKKRQASPPSAGTKPLYPSGAAPQPIIEKEEKLVIQKHTRYYDL